MCRFLSVFSKLTNHSGLVLIFDAKKPPLYFLALCSFLTALKIACNQKKKLYSPRQTLKNTVLQEWS